jgi:sigma-54 specific flagellar transcriptional regulator A
LPPLRERPEEIPRFVEHFATLYKGKDQPIRLDPSFMNAIQRYEWPGNIRELSNLIQRLAVLYPGETVNFQMIHPAMLPTGLQHLATVSEVESPIFTVSQEEDSYLDIVMSARGVKPVGDENFSLKETLNSVEKEMISRALNEVGGNVSMCARMLKVQRTTLIERIKKYSLG